MGGRGSSSKTFADAITGSVISSRASVPYDADAYIRQIDVMIEPYLDRIARGNAPANFADVVRVLEAGKNVVATGRVMELRNSDEAYTLWSATQKAGYNTRTPNVWDLENLLGDGSNRPLAVSESTWSQQRERARVAMDGLSRMGYTVEEVASLWRLNRMYSDIADRYYR